MADKAHELTDLKLEEMEKRLSAIYSRAEKEIQKTADEYFARFAKQDEAKRKLLEQGKITEEEYTKWRKDKVMYGKRFTEMKDQCAKQLLNVNQTALAYVNGQLPEVYAINYNALESAVDGVGGYSFTLVDADTVRNLAVTDTSLLPYKKLDPAKDIPWNMKKINAETLQGILQGESMDKIAKRLRNVQEMNKTQAIRSARTIVTGAENKGRQDSYARAEADGIILQKEWLSTNDGRTRHSHAVLDGAIVDQDKKFENGLMYPGDPSGRPEEVYNCFVGETKVASDSDVVRSYKHKYDGKIISIKTAGGVQFSCTPNHPILTPNGWVAAELLNNGNNILVTFGENNVFSRVNPNINHRFPRIDTIHKFGKKLRSKRTSCLGVDFHGDVATSNVEIITHKRFLGDVRNSSGRNGVDKFLFKLSNKTLSCFGPLFKHFWSVCKTSFCFIGCKCKSLPFFKCSVGHSCEHGFGTIANRDSVLTEYSINDLPADTVIDGELLDRLSCKVFLDTIVNVDVSVLSTHVYNLQTENGYYFVNSIVPQDAEKSNGIFAIAKNCRCTLVAKVNGFKKVQVQKAMSEKQVEAPQTTESAIKTANDLGVKYAQFEKMPLEQVNNAIDAVRTLPKDCVPKVIASGKDVSLVTGRPLGRKADQWWGVTYDYRDFSLRTMYLGYDKTDFDGGLIVGLNTQKFKTLDALTKAKKATNDAYFAKTGKYWSFNTDGKATAYHEIGHCFADVRGLPKGWEDASARWAEESACDLLKKPDEAFAEAWAAYHLGDKRLPDYISAIIGGLK